MKIRGFILCIFLMSLNVLQTGCWNYHDIEKFSIVSGFAIDKNDEGNKYLLTIEVIDFEMSGREAKEVSKLIDSEGNTIFDAVRNIINITGKKLYWAHANVVVIGEEVAKEGISPAIDLISRDAEMREEMYIVVSKEKTAKEILSKETMTSEMRSLEISQMLNGQKSLANSPIIQVYDFMGKIEGEGISAVLPAVCIEKNREKLTAKLVGTAIFKSDKLVGFLNSEETKYFLFARNEIDKGLLTLKEQPQSKVNDVSLEIYKSKTNVKPVYSDGKLSIQMNIKTDVSIGEITSSVDYIMLKNNEKLKADAEDFLKKSVESLIRKVQNEYETDIFGFGMIVKADLPRVWREVQPNLDSIYKKLEVKVNANVNIRNSALSSKIIEKGD